VAPRHVFDTSAYRYSYEQVSTTNDLNEVLTIAGVANRHDRFSSDPEMPRWYSGARYEAYVRQSFDLEADKVWRLRERASGTAVAFRTHRRLACGDLLLLLDGVAPVRPTVGVGIIAA
jgi:hypothetical protein